MANSLKKCANLILTDYLAWYETGIKTGVWLQEGIFDLEGPAGIGKTEVLYQISKILREEKNVPAATVTELFVSSAMDPESVAGTPAPGVTEITLPDGTIEKIPTLRMHYREELIAALNRGAGGILFLDEIGREPRHMRPLLLKLLSPQKSLAGLDMTQMYVIVAGNPSDEEHLVDSILEDAAIASRLCRLQVLPDVEDWADYMYPRSATHREVANFILENPKMILGRDKQGELNSAFHSPRSWTFAASKLHVHGGGGPERAGSLQDESAIAVVNSIIGSQAGAALKNFMTKDRPMSIKDILGGKVKPDQNGRITAMPPSVMKSLQYHIQTKELQDTEVTNLCAFLDCISADYAAAITRDNKKVHPKNMVKFAAAGVFNKFIDRVHRRVKSS